MDFDQTLSIGVCQAREFVDEPRSEASDAQVDDVHANVLNIPQANFHRGNVEVIHRAVLISSIGTTNGFLCKTTGCCTCYSREVHKFRIVDVP